MITYVQAIILGLLQGVTELFPISSLGHSVLLPAIFHWQIDESGNFFLIFLVATHLATALVLLGFFYRDWILIIKGFFRSIIRRKIEDIYEKLAWLIVIATIPVGLLGLLFEDTFKKLFSSAPTIAVFLILNGVMLFILEKMAQKRAAALNPGGGSPDENISKLSWWKTFGIGASEALALLPGFSRTGAALGGGLSAGLDHQAAARFSFLLATPVILAAAVLKLPELVHSETAERIPVLIGFISSGIAAYFSIRFLTNHFKTRTLYPFAIYCVIAGILSIIILGFR